jgi:hypothetical protein
LIIISLISIEKRTILIDGCYRADGAEGVAAAAQLAGRARVVAAAGRGGGGRECGAQRALPVAPLGRARQARRRHRPARRPHRLPRPPQQHPQPPRGILKCRVLFHALYKQEKNADQSSQLAEPLPEQSRQEVQLALQQVHGQVELGAQTQKVQP